MEDYRVSLPMYSGPMDLLLYLIRKAELDIIDVEISVLLEQYMAHLGVIKALDIDAAGDFMVMASRLMEIKSRSLLPRETADEDDDEELIDPREELVRELLEYKRFRDRSRELEKRIDDMDRRFARPHVRRPGAEKTETEDDDFLEEVTLWDLVTAFSRISKEVLANLPTEIIDSDTPISEYMNTVVNRLEETPEQAVSFSSLFTKTADRIELVGLFIAVLELVKQRRIRAEQSSTGEINIVMRDELEEEEIPAEEEEPSPLSREDLTVIEGEGGRESGERTETAEEKKPEGSPPAQEEGGPDPEGEAETPEGEQRKSFLSGIDQSVLDRLKKDIGKLQEFEQALDGLDDIDD